MNVVKLEMPTAVNTEEIEKYREAVEQWPDDEDYRTVYRFLKETPPGTELLDLTEQLDVATNPEFTLDTKGRPCLAIARADRLQVRVESWSHQFNFSTDYRSRMGGPMRDGVISVASPAANVNSQAGYALVPIIPPNFRKGRERMAHMFVHWQVVQWADAEISVRPDRDPMLLRRVLGQTYAIVGEWMVTAAERGALVERARRLANRF